MSNLLLDTCALIWSAWGEPISDAAHAALNDAARRRQPIYTSAISAWELGHLVSRNRLRLPIPPARWFRQVVEKGGLTLSDLSPELLADSCLLPATPPSDPADRIIIATARELDLTIVTRDRLILGYAEEGHVRAITC